MAAGEVTPWTPGGEEGDAGMAPEPEPEPEQEPLTELPEQPEGAASLRHLEKSRAASVLQRAIPRRLHEAAAKVAEMPGRAFWTVEDQAASQIQARVRGRQARKKAEHEHKAATKIQAVHRGCMSRRQTKEDKEEAKRRAKMAPYELEAHDKRKAELKEKQAAAELKRVEDAKARRAEIERKSGEKPKWKASAHADALHLRRTGQDAPEDHDAQTERQMKEGKEEAKRRASMAPAELKAYDKHKAELKEKQAAEEHRRSAEEGKARRAEIEKADSEKPRWGGPSHGSALHLRQTGQDPSEDVVVAPTHKHKKKKGGWRATNEHEAIRYGDGSPTTAGQVAAWDASDRLTAASTWRGLGSQHKTEIFRRAALLRGVALFSKFSTAQLRKFAIRMERLQFNHGEVVCGKGQPGSEMYIIDEGGCAIFDGPQSEGPDAVLPVGAVFGHLTLLTGERRKSTVVADGETQMLRLRAGDVRAQLSALFGNPTELARRVDCLREVELFNDFSQGELLQLAAVVDKAVFPVTGTKIVEQGKRGRHMYVLWEGEASVHVDSRRIAELTEGDIFGETALSKEADYRTATVKTTKPDTVCLRLAQADWHRVLSDDRCIEVIQRAGSTYLSRDALRVSPRIGQAMNKYYKLMVDETSRLAGTKAKQELSATHARWQMLRREVDTSEHVAREAYVSLHLAMTKVLFSDFDMEKASENAQKEWAEDISHFSGDSRVSIWLEEVKVSLRDATRTIVYKLSWASIFEMADVDGSGELDVKEFREAARNVMNIPASTVSDRELGLLFDAAETGGDGQVSGPEFAAFISQAPHTVQMMKGMSRQMQNALRSVIKMVQQASNAVAMETGWTKLFETYDRDGQGSLDLQEFTAILREDCKIDEKVIPDEHLAQLLKEVDTDGTGDIDAHEFQKFLSSEPLAAGMSFECFGEAIFQLATSWVPDVNWGDMDMDGLSMTEEDKYVAWLESLLAKVTVEHTNMHLRSGKETVVADLEKLDCAVDAEGKYVDDRMEQIISSSVSSRHAREDRDFKPIEHTKSWKGGGTNDGVHREMASGPEYTTPLYSKEENAMATNSQVCSGGGAKGMSRHGDVMQWNIVGTPSKSGHALPPNRKSIFQLATLAAGGGRDYESEMAEVLAHRDIHEIAKSPTSEFRRQNPNCIGSWRDPRLIGARATKKKQEKPTTPRLATFRNGNWKAAPQTKGRSKAMAPHPPKPRRQKANRIHLTITGEDSSGGASWVLVEPPAVEEIPPEPPEPLDPQTQHRIKTELKDAIASRVTLYGQIVTDVQSFYNCLDIDASGGISVEELSTAFRRLEVDVSRKQMDSLLVSVDKNEDGQVSVKELKEWLNQDEPVAAALWKPSAPALDRIHETRNFRERMLPDMPPGVLARAAAADERRKRDNPDAPALVDSSRWHSPRGSLTKNMGSHPKTPYNRQGDLLGDGSLRVPHRLSPGQHRLNSIVQHRQSGQRMWEVENAPERSRKFQIQSSVDDASKRRALSERLPRLGGSQRGGRRGVSHAEIAAIVAGTGGHGVPKPPGVLREPIRRERRPATVRTMSKALTGRM